MKGTHCFTKYYRILFKIRSGFLTLLLFSSSVLTAQQVTLDGRIFSKADSKPLDAVTVHVISSNSGTFTDASGDFRISLPAARHKIVFSLIGYYSLDTVLNLQNDLTIRIFLVPSDISLGEVKVTGEGGENAVSSVKMGSVTVTRKEILTAPSLLGESDPLGLLKLTPGVSSGSEGTSGFYVRGGTTDQNLILYDNVLVYNPGHLLGFFSVFNPDIVRDVRLLKSGIPARYGGKLSSVILIESYRGNPDSIEVSGSAGLISTRLSVNGPLPGKTGTFVIGARRTYLDLFVEPAVRRFAGENSFLSKDNKYNFYDINASVTLALSDRDHLEASAYRGRDGYRMIQRRIDQENALKWGNNMAAIGWNHNFNGMNSWRTGFSYTGYSFDLKGSQSDYFFGLFSSVEDFSLRSDIILRRNKYTLITGFELTEHGFIPNKINARADNFILNFGQFSPMHALEGAVFADAEFNVSPVLSLSGGLRLSFFDHHGPYKSITRNSYEQTTDTIFYPAGRSLALYGNPEPRVILKYQPGANSSLKLSYMRTAQYVHLATSAAISLPTDMWIPSTSQIKPMTADQLSLGYFRNFHDKDYELSTELYYKRMNNKLEFLRGIVSNSIYGSQGDNIAVGYARSYGFEVLLRRKKGFFTGWISYTLAHTEQRFDMINDGRFYPAKYDRRHDLAITVSRKLNEKWSSSAVFVLASGNAYTVPVGRYVIQGNLLNQYGEVNTFRMPPYHRLDLSLSRKTMIFRKWTSELNFSIYNVYNRINPYFIWFEAKGNIETYSLEIKAHKAGLFPVIPSVSWNFSF